LGLAQSIARPSGNITGTWFDYDAVVGKRLEFLKLAVPALARVGVIITSRSPPPPRQGTAPLHQT
jgi:ABC-type uncharacterized transport system substrate-binding protein